MKVRIMKCTEIHHFDSGLRCNQVYSYTCNHQFHQHKYQSSDKESFHIHHDLQDKILQ